MFKSFKLVGAALALALPVSANALTLNLTDNVNSGGTITIEDGVGNILDGNVSFAGSFGGFDLSLAAGAQNNFPPLDSLFASLSAANLSEASGDLTLEVSHVFDNTGNALGALGDVVYSLTQSLNTLLGVGTVQTFYGLTEFDKALSLNEIASAENSGANVITSGIFDAENYSITHVINLQSNSSAGALAGSATIIAPVPIPAAGFLLFGALGGLGLAARRRQKKAA